MIYEGGKAVKKLLAYLLPAFICCFGAASAEEELPVSAARQVITAIAAEVNPEHLSDIAVNARILSYSSGDHTLTLELIVPEIYDRQEVQSLSVGDAIYTQGKEVLIQTLTEKGGYLVINEGDFDFSEGSVWLYESDGGYQIADWHDNTWTTLAAVRTPVRDSLLFLDYINPSSGESLALPAVHSADEFLSMLKTEDGEGRPGFAANNVYVVFDDAGQLAAIHRYYVPWQ